MQGARPTPPTPASFDYDIGSGNPVPVRDLVELITNSPAAAPFVLRAPELSSRRADAHPRRHLGSAALGLAPPGPTPRRPRTHHRGRAKGFMNDFSSLAAAAFWAPMSPPIFSNAAGRSRSSMRSFGRAERPTSSGFAPRPVRANGPSSSRTWLKRGSNPGFPAARPVRFILPPRRPGRHDDLALRPAPRSPHQRPGHLQCPRKPPAG